MDEHTHKVRYTLYTQPTAWWKRLFGIVEKRTYTGVRSSQSGGELLIFQESGFHSINYARVIRMSAEPLPDTVTTEASSAGMAAQGVDAALPGRKWEVAQES